MFHSFFVLFCILWSLREFDQLHITLGIMANTHPVGVLLSKDVAEAVLSKKQQLIPMAFQCRSVSKQTSMLAVTKVTSSEGASEQYVIAGKLQFVSNRRMTDEKLVEEGLKNSSACLPRSMEDIDSLRAQLSLPRKAKAVPIWEVSTICRYDPMIVLEDGMVTFASGTNQD